jgi:hypothetical protein
MPGAFAGMDVEYGSIKDATPGRIDAEVVQRRHIATHLTGVVWVYSCSIAFTETV